MKTRRKEQHHVAVVCALEKYVVKTCVCVCVCVCENVKKGVCVCVCVCENVKKAGDSEVKLALASKQFVEFRGTALRSTDRESCISKFSDNDENSLVVVKQRVGFKRKKFR